MKSRRLVIALGELSAEQFIIYWFTEEPRVLARVVQLLLQESTLTEEQDAEHGSQTPASSD